MTKPDSFFTAQEFANKAGVSSGTVTKWLREGFIKGQKTNGKWSIDTAELAKITRQENATDKSPKSTVAKSDAQTKVPSTAAKSYSIQEFCDMTYLTEYGVRQWLKQGRLIQVVDSNAQVRVDAVNLENPHIKRLLR